MHRLHRSLPFWSSRRGDIPGVLFVVVLIALVVYVSVKFPEPFGKHVVGGGFGPGWSCQYVAKGEPICVRNVPKRLDAK